MINITNMTDEQYYTIEEVAKMLKVAYLTVYRWIQDNKLPSVKAGKQYRIKKNDLDNFLNSYKGKN
ncbi:DNA-binding protein [Candidatus Roizmanbacteria bacterium CG22_combo_CG10-13_8_21_14_all_38_20]|uniref:DNA-binding protein n=1 Tax=Candidatus Roizmanbacteria bacterium CG22_combo_CG10-13_8_21_14_all_38_20 TaxID=1974862 RepID=A0A2H0BV62_9BACT|nr:helix-turn-helix domain-containing protein [Candidatus Microgenomates bacterium]PIP61521.1 MAG: DNA-binding protein [Candidatus Roizmanbacteria bacterium CG22_combo_CG10-13_8_21_14_all_38_20]PJC32287.1 MAG: DNA-binding protein [Candidatus Roizmanbacteria bacterium CG_4_9_14_0_2_um_filter_38_17]